MEKYLCLKESDVVIPDGDVESSSNDEDKDSDDDGDDDKEEEEEKDRDNADIEQDVAGEEDIMENIVKSREDQPTETIEQQVTVSEAHWWRIQTIPGKYTLSHKWSQIPTISHQDEHQDEFCSQATAFMGVSKDATRSPEDIQSTPLPGETLAMFYACSR